VSEQREAAAPGMGLIAFVLAIGIATMLSQRFARPVALTNSMEGASFPATEVLGGYRINLNDASAAELEVLPEVGPNLAERIVQDRDERGGFESIEELTRVHGIGERTVRRIEPFLRIGEIIERNSEN